MKREDRQMLMIMTIIAAMVLSATASAATDLEQKMSDPANWTAQAGGYANQRRSDNVYRPESHANVTSAAVR